ncbi:MAG: LysR substrate-binding domain-containing protein [Kofleriaceae bacterium]
MSHSLDDMAVFAAVVRDGGFTAAARTLGITKQSVSARVAGLEARLGVQLMVRSTRALRLTESGQQYHEACASIVAQAEAAERVARQAQQHAAGTIRVTAPAGLSHMLMTVVRELRQRHPEVRVELVLEEKLVDLIRDGIDLAIRTGSLASTPSFVARFLFDTELVLVASPAFVKRHGRPTRVSELVELPCIVKGTVRSWHVDGETVALDAHVIVNTFEAARDAALEGLGIARVPLLLVQHDLDAKRLERLWGPGSRIPFSALWPARRLPLRVRLFLEVLTRRAEAMGAGRARD